MVTKWWYCIGTSRMTEWRYGWSSVRFAFWKHWTRQTATRTTHSRFCKLSNAERYFMWNIVLLTALLGDRKIFILLFLMMWRAKGCDDVHSFGSSCHFGWNEKLKILRFKMEVHMIRWHWTTWSAWTLSRNLRGTERKVVSGGMLLLPLISRYYIGVSATV